MIGPSRSTAVRRVLPLLKLATRIVDKVPSRSDTWAQKLAKTLSILDITNEVYGSGRSKMRELADQHGLVEQESETFVRVFFATALRDAFQLRRHAIGEHEDAIEATDGDGERIFFRETHYSTARLEGAFYVTPHFNFARMIDRLWQLHPDGIYLSVTTDDNGWRKETAICEVPSVPVDRLSCAARERLEAAVARHRVFTADGVHRSYLLFGPPGTGKSSFAALFARSLGGRALKLDATSLPLLGVKEFGFLLDTLRPGCLILDDLDRAPLDKVGARVLFLLERLKTRYPAMTVVLSVNDPSKLDCALLRCGRIDIPIEFAPPGEGEIRAVVAGLLEAHGVERRAGLVEAIVSGAEQLSHAYLDDLCRRLRHESLEDVLASVNLLKSLAEKAGAPKPSGSSPS